MPEIVAGAQVAQTQKSSWVGKKYQQRSVDKVKYHPVKYHPSFNLVKYHPVYLDTLQCGRRYVDFRGVKCVKWSTVERRRGVMELDVSYFPGPLTRADVKSPGSLTVKSS